MHTQVQSPLFQLPGEIREKIQREVLKPNDAADLLFPSTQHPEDHYVNRPYAEGTPALMGTCKRMQTEMSSFAFSHAMIHETEIGFGTRIGMKVHGALRWDRLRQISVVVATKYSNVAKADWSTFLNDVLELSPSVETVVVHWHPLNPWREVEQVVASVLRRGEDPERDEEVRWTRERFGRPDWVEYLVRHPGLREVRFEGDVPAMWLESLREGSGGRIKVSANFEPLEGGAWQTTSSFEDEWQGEGDRIATVLAGVVVANDARRRDQQGGSTDGVEPAVSLSAQG